MPIGLLVDKCVLTLCVLVCLCVCALVYRYGKQHVMQLAHFNITASSQRQSEDELRVSFNKWLVETHDKLTGNTSTGIVALKPEKRDGESNRATMGSTSCSTESLYGQVWCTCPLLS